MGILRTDKISGLETPTAVTGSVLFDGLLDYVTIPLDYFYFSQTFADFTIWMDGFWKKHRTSK